MDTLAWLFISVESQDPYLYAQPTKVGNQVDKVVDSLLDIFEWTDCNRSDPEALLILHVDVSAYTAFQIGGNTELVNVVTVNRWMKQSGSAVGYSTRERERAIKKFKKLISLRLAIELKTSVTSSALGTLNQSMAEVMPDPS